MKIHRAHIHRPQGAGHARDGAAGTDTDRRVSRRTVRKISALVAMPTLAATVFTALLTTTAQSASAAARSNLPFSASFSGSVTPPNGPPPVALSGTGKASFLGRSTNSGSISVTGSAGACPDTGFAVENDEVLTSTDDGDQITIAIHDEVCPISPGIFRGQGTYVVTGGTGRFAGASGQGACDGTGDFVHGLFSFTLTGTISKPLGG